MLELLPYDGTTQILDSNGLPNNWQAVAYQQIEPLTRKGVNVDLTAPFWNYNYSEIARVNFLPGDSIQGIDANNFYRYHYLTPDELQWAQVKYTRDANGNWKPSSAVAYGVERSADFGNFLKFAAPLFLLALPGIGQAIGSAAFSAAGISVSPSLAAALGNTAISAALNGGDIEAALKGQLAGTLGGFAGSLSQSVVDSAALAKAISAATTAAATGGDYEKAILFSLASSGVKAMDSYDWFGGGEEMLNPSSGPVQFEAFASPGVYDPNGFAQPYIYPESYFSDPQGNYDAPAAAGIDYSGNYHDPVYSEWDDAPTMADASMWDETYGPVVAPVYSGSIPITPPLSPSQQAGNNGGNNWFESAISGITALAMAAIKIVPALKNLDSGSVIKTGTMQNGQITTANNNGTVTLRDPNTGATRTTVPPVGVAYQTADGNLITNNGNGTYTVVRPDGSRFTGTYTAASVAGGAGGSGGNFLSDPNNKPLIYGALALGAVLLLKGK